jgi:DNA-binding response OmpR family regulator
MKYVRWRTDGFFRFWLWLPPADNKGPLMNMQNDMTSIILVVEDVEETRDGIEKLLQADGYRVVTARDENDAVESARRQAPDLILLSLAGLPRDIVVIACEIRTRADLGEDVPVVLFCIDEVREGDEIGIGRNVYITRPDNFNQLRSLLTRLLLNEQNAVLTPEAPAMPTITKTSLQPARFEDYVGTVPFTRKGSVK